MAGSTGKSPKSDEGFKFLAQKPQSLHNFQFSFVLSLIELAILLNERAEIKLRKEG
jgi:hypothetical protein